MSNSIKIKLDETYDFNLIGLVSSEPIYKISWLVNEKLHILLKETTPIQVYHPKKQVVQEFNRFTFKTPLDLNYYIIENKGSQGLFIEEYKQIDFWLIIEDLNLKINHVLSTLKEIKNVNLALEIKPGSLKSKNRILFSEDNLNEDA